MIAVIKLVMILAIRISNRASIDVSWFSLSNERTSECVVLKDGDDDDSDDICEDDDIDNNDGDDIHDEDDNDDDSNDDSNDDDNDDKVFLWVERFSLWFSGFRTRYVS